MKRTITLILVFAMVAVLFLSGCGSYNVTVTPTGDNSYTIDVSPVDGGDNYTLDVNLTGDNVTSPVPAKSVPASAVEEECKPEPAVIGIPVPAPEPIEESAEDYRSMREEILSRYEGPLSAEEILAVEEELRSLEERYLTK